jgi:hypothetical protein
MSQSICLTPKQQKFYNYFVKYHKENGFFPNPTRACAELREDGVKTSVPQVTNMYGTLFVKGAFNGGVPLINTYRARHSAKPVATIDISKLTFADKPKAKPANKQEVVAAALLELLKSSPKFNEIAAALNA